MTYAPTDLLTVYLDAGERLKVGRLALRQRRILFEYDPGFIATGIELSPFKLPLQPGVFTPSEMIFDGLFGVFNDSLPDGWGRPLLDRAVEEHGVHHDELNPLDRLAYVGRDGMGALSYEPDLSQPPKRKARLALDKLAEESRLMLSGEAEDVFEELLALNGSSAGARPQIVAQVNADKSRVIHDHAGLEPGYAHWMIKFANSQDPRDIGAIEFAYSLMAKEAGVVMPETHLFRTRKRGYSGVKRFDRAGEKRLHMHSLSGLIHADHQAPSLDYDLVLRAAQVLTKSILEVEKAYALACFNVLAHNRDDHAKNFSFLMNEDHAWTFAPAYDLTFSGGPGGEQSTMVMSEARNPGVKHLEALGREHGLKNAPGILDKVRSAVARWRDHAETTGVTARSTKIIADRLRTLR